MGKKIYGKSARPFAFALLWLFEPLVLSESYACAAAVLVDELDAGGF
jgi:hypothetical protein